MAVRNVVFPDAWNAPAQPTAGRLMPFEARRKNTQAAVKPDFQIYLNGANRSLGMPAKPKAPLERPSSRPLRVVGAIPVSRRSDEPPTGQRRQRRQWSIGQAVLVKTHDGAMLQLDASPPSVC